MNKRRSILVTILVTMAVLALMTLVLTAGAATAQTPSTPGSTLPYSGHLTDPSGQPVADGQYDFVFTLYASEKDDRALWSEMQSGLNVKSGNLNVVLGQSVPMSKDVADRKDLWLSVSVRGPHDSDFTLLNPRHNLNAPNAVNALTCPHSHFTDYWYGNNTDYGLITENDGAGDGIRAYSYATRTNYAALYAVNNASTGYGTAVYGSSDKGLGVYAASGTGDGLEATTSSTTGKSAIYAHSTSGNGVWAVSGSSVGVHGGSASNYGVEGLSTSNYGGYFEATSMVGGRMQTDLPASYYGAVIDGGLHIINGNCVGCTLVYFGQNGGAAAIEKGDLVAVAGAKVDAATQQPILLVRRATSADDAVIGVAVGAAASPSDVNRSGPATVGKSGVGVIATGEYVQVMISGLAQVKVNGKVAIGSRLAPSSEGAVLAGNASNSVARVMSEPDENGFVWVLVNGR